MSAMPNDTPQIQHAIYYARMGWSVVPANRIVTTSDGQSACTCKKGVHCPSKGKHPAVDWTEFQSRRATEAEIHAWFTGYYAEYGVGIITGAISGFFVVDVDTGLGKIGDDTLNDLQFIHGDLPHTVEAKTGGGGRHILLKHPGPGVNIATKKNILGPGVDIRGDGGFIVAAPSLHASGRLYLWNENAHPRNTEIADAPGWVVEMSAGTPSPSGTRHQSTGDGEIVRNAWGKVIDGRETHMRGIVWAVIANMLRQTGKVPDADAVFVEAWPTYERTTAARGPSLEADGRGETAMRQKINYALQRASARMGPSESKREDAGQQSEDASSDTSGQAGQRQKSSDPDIYHTLDIAALMALPPVQWLIDGILTTDGFSIVYGPPGSLKTFLVLDWMLHVATGRPWNGKAVRPGKILYVAGEGVRGIARRIKAWCEHHGVDPDTIPFRLLPASVDLTKPENIAKLVRTAIAQMEEDGECVAGVVIDTVARSIPGLDENSAQEMGLFVAAVDTVKASVSCHLLGVHHSGKDETRGARGSNALLGAVDTMTKVKREKERLTVTVEKQKDDEEGEPIKLRTKQVEWLDGLKPIKSIVLVPDNDLHHAPSEVDEDTTILRKVAFLLGENGRLIINRISMSLGLSGRKKQELINLIPLLPDYATVSLGENGPTVRLAKRRTGSGTTSPVEVVRYDPV